MAVLTKLVSGIMYEDKFDSFNLLWELSPNDFDRILIENNSVKLRHGAERISMSIPSNTEEYVFQAKVSHEPISITDIGGVLVSSTTDNSIECQTYFDPNIVGDQYSKTIKVHVKDDVYTFSSSVDGTLWRTIGNAELPDANQIGFYLDGEQNETSKDFMIYSVSIYKSSIITLNNVSFSSTIKVLNEEGVDVLEDEHNIVKQYNAKTYIDLSNVIFPLKNATIQIFDGDLKTSEIVSDLCGGDIYECSENITITIDGVLINPNEIYDLGNLQSYSTTYLLNIKNSDSKALVGRRLSVVAYSIYNRGQQFASIAIDDGSTALVYGKQLSLPTIYVNNSIDVRMRIDKDINNLGPFLADKYKFKIVLE